MLINAIKLRVMKARCTRARDKDCKCGYINEEDLIKQLEELIDDIDLDEIETIEKVKAEVERFKRFQRVALGNKEKIQVGDIDIRNYARRFCRLQMT
jgi:hypothetical protein